LGSPNHRFANFYATNAQFTQNTDLPGVSSASFTIFTSNNTNDASSSYLAFHRGSATPDAKLTWDAQNKQFNFNFPVSLNGSVFGLGTASSSFSGPVWFTGTPTGASISNGSIYVNPSTANVGDTLFGIAVNGVQKFKVDAQGDITGYSGLTLTNGETIQGTTGLALSGANAPITFSGTGTHLISASSGTLELGDVTLAGNISGNGLQDLTDFNHIDAKTASLSVGLELTGDATASVGGNAYFGSNVGIGTSNPTTALYINGGNATINNNDPVLQISDSDSSTRSASIKLATAAGNWTIKQDNDLNFIGPNGDTRLELGRLLNTIGAKITAPAGATADIFQVASSSGTPFFNVTSAGNVGIGTTAPQYKLDVSGDGRFTGGLSFGSFASVSTNFEVGGYASIGGNLYVAGNVGIGTTNPLAALDVYMGSEASTSAPNTVLVLDSEPSSATVAGGGTALEFRGKSSGGGTANYQQA
ncbi:MAG TPA: hypothetical protein VFK03_00735, partial [Candidatus Saccharimonadales bacterium]|nr:hypothetical protein [Candidatus Saccharimonadales bacterium]